MKVDKGIATYYGIQRQMGHENNSTERWFDDPNEENIIGVAGEIAFGEWSGLRVDLRVRPRGDRCIDFTFGYKGRIITIDVKTARKPYHLLLKAKDADRCANILVLAGIEDIGDEFFDIEFYGWATRKTMRSAPIKDFGYGMNTHAVHQSKLNQMVRLYNAINN